MSHLYVVTNVYGRTPTPCKHEFFPQLPPNAPTPSPRERLGTVKVFVSASKTDHEVVYTDFGLLSISKLVTLHILLLPKPQPQLGPPPVRVETKEERRNRLDLARAKHDLKYLELYCDKLYAENLQLKDECIALRGQLLTLGVHCHVHN